LRTRAEQAGGHQRQDAGDHRRVHCVDAHNRQAHEQREPEHHTDSSECERAPLHGARSRRAHRQEVQHGDPAGDGGAAERHEPR
jgi:hypothetical protein